MEYFEKPVTDVEKKIATLLEKMAYAFSTHNSDLLHEILSENSTLAVMVDKEKILDKNGYIDYMSEAMRKIRIISYRDVLMRIINKDEATLCCWCFISFYGKISPLVTQRYFKCRREGDTWRIVEAQYIK